MSTYYTMADIERIGPAGCLQHMNELHKTNSRLCDEIERLSAAEQIDDPDVVQHERTYAASLDVTGVWKEYRR